MDVATEWFELEEQIAADVECRVGKGESVHAGVAELPDALECLELADNLVDVNRAGEVRLEEGLGIGEHGHSSLVVDL